MKLNLGCGPPRSHKKGYVNVDSNPLCNPTVLHDIRTPLPWDNNSTEVVDCENLFDSIDRVDFNKLLREIYRVLKPGGILNFIQADVAKNIDMFVGWPYFKCGVTAYLFRFYQVGDPCHETWKDYYGLPGFVELQIQHNQTGVMIGSMRKPNG